MPTTITFTNEENDINFTIGSLVVSNAVITFNGRQGAVLPETDDYTWAQINKTTSDIADLTSKSHASLTLIGTNTHAQIDTHVDGDGSDHANVSLNDTHRTSDGKNHSDVVLNNTHRSSDGTDHSNVALNDTHRGSDGKNHSDVVLNNSHRTGDGSDHSNVALNDTHRGSDGKNHSDVVLNNTHRADSANPHGTDLANLGSGTLAELNTNITDENILTQQEIIDIAVEQALIFG